MIVEEVCEKSEQWNIANGGRKSIKDTMVDSGGGIVLPASTGDGQC